MTRSSPSSAPDAERRAELIANPESPSSITAAWLTAALTQAGVLVGGRVAAFELVPLGADRGLTGRVVRVLLSYERCEQEAPRSLIAKFAAEPGPTRTLAERFDLYRREAHFYEVFAAETNVPTPRAYYASNQNQPFVLLLEDLEGGHEVDLRAGCNLEQAALVVDLLAGAHAQFWNDPSLVAEEWLPPPNHDVILTLIDEYAVASWSKFRSQFGAHMPPSLLKLGTRVARDRTVLDRLAAPPWTLVHADMRAHNIIFEGSDHSRPRAVIDWQTAMRGRGPIDLASFFTSSLSVVDRRIAEAELLPTYHQRLIDSGVRGYSYADCWRDYCLAAINQFSQVVALFSLIDVNDRIEDDVAASTGERLVAALIDLNVVDLVPAADWQDALALHIKRAIPQPLRRALRSLPL